jgi:hypothetical protein
MKASFDGIRFRMAREFNRLARTKLSPDQIEPMEGLRDTVVGLLCMYDENAVDDCRDLSGEVTIEEIKKGDERA